jgi:hypothetical protein
MEFIHPIQQHAASVPSLWAMAERQAAEWDATVTAMEALQPNDPTAETVLRNASALLQSLITNYGHRDWHVQQSHLIWQTAERVFGAGQLKFNKPAVRLDGPTSRARGDGMNYKHHKLRSGEL